VPEGVRVAKLATGELGPLLAWTHPIEHAAFAPGADRVALAGGGELALFSLTAAEPLARWSEAPIRGLAFRQDGAALFVGINNPTIERALDPSTGAELGPELLSPDLVERIRLGSIDPTWRWVLVSHDTLLRTLDGQTLIFSSGEGIRTGSGWYEGDPRMFASTLRVRLGHDVRGEVYTIEDLADQLRRPSLLVDFLSGQPLPLPRVRAPRERP
jgi:hypothetical protein